MFQGTLISHNKRMRKPMVVMVEVVSAGEERESSVAKAHGMRGIKIARGNAPVKKEENFESLFQSVKEFVGEGKDEGRANEGRASGGFSIEEVSPNLSAKADSCKCGGGCGGSIEKTVEERLRIIEQKLDTLLDLFEAD